MVPGLDLDRDLNASMAMCVYGSTGGSTVHPRGQGKRIMKVAEGLEVPKAETEGGGPGSGVEPGPERVSDDDIHEEQPEEPSFV